MNWLHLIAYQSDSPGNKALVGGIVGAIAALILWLFDGAGRSKAKVDADEKIWREYEAAYSDAKTRNMSDEQADRHARVVSGFKGKPTSSVTVAPPVQQASVQATSNAESEILVHVGVEPVDAESITFFIAPNRIEQGPFTLDILRQKVAEGEFTSKTLAWREGQTGWEEARAIPELRTLFGAIPPPLPPE